MNRNKLCSGWKSLSVCILVLGFCLTANADTFFVKPGGTGDGSSWTLAFSNPQQALTAAVDTVGSDEIWVAQGRYVPTLETVPGDPRSKTFKLVPNCKVYGGFAGTEPATEAGFLMRDPKANLTTLSGDLNDDNPNDPFAYGDDCYHVVTARFAGPQCILDGFTIAYGNAVGSGPADPEVPTPGGVGGGMIIIGSDFAPQNSSAPKVLRCTFLFNRALQGGGAFFTAIQGSRPQFRNCRFHFNTATGSGTAGGGAVHAFNPGCPAVQTQPESVLVGQALISSTASSQATTRV